MSRAALLKASHSNRRVAFTPQLLSGALGEVRGSNDAVMEGRYSIFRLMWGNILLTTWKMSTLRLLRSLISLTVFILDRWGKVMQLNWSPPDMFYKTKILCVCPTITVCSHYYCGYMSTKSSLTIYLYIYSDVGLLHSVGRLSWETMSFLELDCH